jgi:hypothetical protein
LDGFAVALTISLDELTNEFCGIPNHQEKVTFSTNAGYPANEQF